MTDITTEPTDDASKLKTTNADLRAQLKTANANLTSLQERLDELEADRDAANSAGQSDIDRLTNTHKREMDKKDNEIKKLKEALGDRDVELSQYKVDAVVRQMMDDHHVLPEYHEAVAAILTKNVKMVNGEALVGDIPLADHGAEFFGSARANAFVDNGDNSGGGATGTSTKAPSHDFTKQNIKERESEWLALSVSNPDLFKQVAKDTGRTEVL